MKAKVKKLIRFIGLILLVVVAIASTVAFVVTRLELNKLNQTYADATSELNKDNENKQVRIEDLRTGFTQLTAEVSKLKTENESLKAELNKMQTVGFGEISGKIIPFVTTGVGDFSQYQRVCAEQKQDRNSQYCRSVSALDQEFSFSLPAGEYYVYAELFPQPAADSPLYQTKAYYTTYVQCVLTKSTTECQTAESKPLEIKVTAGDRLKDINPIDWRKQT